jgi:hypothetical protein
LPFQDARYHFPPPPLTNQHALECELVIVVVVVVVVVRERQELVTGGG